MGVRLATCLIFGLKNQPRGLFMRICYSVLMLTFTFSSDAFSTGLGGGYSPPNPNLEYSTILEARPSENEQTCTASVVARLRYYPYTAGVGARFIVDGERAANIACAKELGINEASIDCNSISMSVAGGQSGVVGGVSATLFNTFRCGFSEQNHDRFLQAIREKKFGRLSTHLADCRDANRKLLSRTNINSSTKNLVRLRSITNDEADKFGINRLRVFQDHLTDVLYFLPTSKIRETDLRVKINQAQVELVKCDLLFIEYRSLLRDVVNGIDQSGDRNPILRKFGLILAGELQNRPFVAPKDEKERSNLRLREFLYSYKNRINQNPDIMLPETIE